MGDRPYRADAGIRDVASERTWGSVLDRFEARGAKPGTLRGNDEVRWGDSRNQALQIPAASIVPVTARLVQLVDVRGHTARVWGVQFAIEWVNPADGLPPSAPAGPDTLEADFILQTGVGSAKISTFRSLSIAANNPIPVMDLIIAAVPAATLVVEARLTCTPSLGLARQYRGRVLAMVSPVFR